MLSVSSIPIFELGELSGPITYGTTYIVRPRITPSKSLPSLAYASSGAIQLFVGPAATLVREQMNVRCRAGGTPHIRPRADECEVFHPRDVAGIGSVEITAGQLLLIQPEENSSRDSLLGEPAPLLL